MILLEPPTLTTARLTMRPFTLADAPIVQQLVDNPNIADNIPNIPHPYPENGAEQWIASHETQFQQGQVIQLALVRQADQQLVGTIALRSNFAKQHASFGYWMGQPYWGQGYVTEAAQRLLQYSFEELQLHRVEAHHLTHNPASGRVMQKLGMTYEGCRRGGVLFQGQFVDLDQYAILRPDYEAIKTTPRAEPPTMQAARLILRPHQLADAVELQRLGNDADIAANLLSLPHPFTLEMAQARVRGQRRRYEQGQGFAFVITRRQDQAVLGEIGLHVDRENKAARFGYWLGRIYWGQGYGTEAVQTLIRFGFEVLDLNRIYAEHFLRNPVSGKVMQKAGMRYEGRSQQASYKEGIFEDLENYAILRQHYVRVS